MNGERVFGMRAETGRWGFVLLGLVMNLCLGSVYAWSIFKAPVEKALGCSATQGNLPFMTFLAAFALTMFAAGSLMERVGPRWLAMAGAGVGLAYGCPVALAASLSHTFLVFGCGFPRASRPCSTSASAWPWGSWWRPSGSVRPTPALWRNRLDFPAIARKFALHRPALGFRRPSATIRGSIRPQHFSEIPDRGSGNSNEADGPEEPRVLPDLRDRPPQPA
jgi:hypothetical protein